jgi:hypothetical protein
LVPNVAGDWFSAGPVWGPITLMTAVVLTYTWATVLVWRRNALPQALAYAVIVLGAILVGYWRICLGLRDL